MQGRAAERGWAPRRSSSSGQRELPSTPGSRCFRVQAVCTCAVLGGWPKLSGPTSELPVLSRRPHRPLLHWLPFPSHAGPSLGLGRESVASLFSRILPAAAPAPPSRSSSFPASSSSSTVSILFVSVHVFCLLLFSLYNNVSSPFLSFPFLLCKAADPRY